MISRPSSARDRVRTACSDNSFSFSTTWLTTDSGMTDFLVPLLHRRQFHAKFYRAQQAVGLIRPNQWNLGRRIAVVIAVGWLPLFLITALFNFEGLDSLTGISSSLPHAHSCSRFAGRRTSYGIAISRHHRRAEEPCPRIRAIIRHYRTVAQYSPTEGQFSACLHP